MYDNQFPTRLYKYNHPSQTLPTSGKIPHAIGFTPPLEPDNIGMLNKDDQVAVMTPTRVSTRVSPHALTITPPTPASPTPSDADSECSDDSSDSVSSFTGEECPDLCGGPKNSCRSWTPPASPFYYTDERGVFLLDDRQHYEERQKIELKHTLRDLDARLQRLRETMSPTRFLSWHHESEESTPLSHSGKSHGPSERSPRSPTESLAEHSRFATSSQPYSCDCDDTLRRYKLSSTQNISMDSSHHTMSSQEKDGTKIMNLGKLIHTSLQRVQSTNSPPRYLTSVSEIEALRQPNTTNPHEESSFEALLTRHASPQLHLGNTAYPTPLPSSPESRSSRKRGRDKDSEESRGRKRRREEDDGWIPTHWTLQNDQV